MESYFDISYSTITVSSGAHEGVRKAWKNEVRFVGAINKTLNQTRAIFKALQAENKTCVF